MTDDFLGLERNKVKWARAATFYSVTIALILMIIKFISWQGTASVAILGSLVDSFMDLAASLVAFFGVRIAQEPADKNHRFGHQKAEPLAGLAQAVLILLSSLFILKESIDRLVNPIPLENGLAGLGVMVVSLLLTLSVVAFHTMALRRAPSLAVEGDRAHYLGDIISNTIVIIAIILSVGGSYYRADAIAGVIAVLFLVYTAWGITRKSLPQLMDEALGSVAHCEIKAVIEADPEARAMHALRTRRAGTRVFIQFHLELDPQISLARAHQITDRIEGEILTLFPGADITIHQDPHGEVEAHDNYGHRRSEV